MFYSVMLALTSFCFLFTPYKTGLENFISFHENFEYLKMNEDDLKAITVDDFNVICRVCLQNGEDMIDIFKCGLENQFMELTNLKMELNDKLPTTLCQNCNDQINQLFTFLQQAKSSDLYLRSLLPNVVELDSGMTIKKKKCSRRKQKSLRKSKGVHKIRSDIESDKMYLIVVPEIDNPETKGDNEIFIKDLSTDNDNLGLTTYCRTLVRSHFTDHTYPKEQRSSEDENFPLQPFELNYSQDIRHKDINKTYTVNLEIYQCSDCKLAYEEFSDLTAHFSTHNVEPSFLKSNFNCPVCGLSVGEKDTFMRDLRTHKEDGLFFVKVNRIGEIMPLKEHEKDIFMESFPKHTKDCIIFTLSLNSLNCTSCSKNIEPMEFKTVADHLETCLPGKQSDIKFSIKYTCPICQKSFIDREKIFIEHLNSHKEQDYYFIKVDNTGQPIEIGEDDKLFVPFEEAVKIFNKKGKIFKIVDINSCDKCDYSSEFFNDLCEHRSYIHFEKISSEVSCCPVCPKELKSAALYENQTEFYEHLKIHKNEGFSFILVKRNGTMSGFDEKYSDIFTQSLFLWSLINSSSVIIQSISPELILLDEKNLSGKYTCDFCKKKFKNKHEIIVHLKFHKTNEAVQDSVNYICEKCGKKCSGKLNYKKHFLKHSKVLSVCKRPICSICKKKFANRATLNGHMRHHLKEENGNRFHTSLLGIICEKCGRSFSNNASLTKHKKTHLKEVENTVLKCEICDRDFFRQTSFDRHKSAHLNPKYFECGICKLPLSSVASLQKHSEIHKNGSNTFDCKVCQLSFLTRDSLTAHQTHTGHYFDRKPLECNVCHEKFFIGRKFSQHIKTHPKYKMGECTLCGKRLSTIQSLMLHMGRHFESNSILCPHCGKQFFEERNYHRHLLTHEGIKPFPCDIEGCKKSFYTLFELNRHKKYHNNTRDFRCTYCSKSFHEANHLTVHIRTHTGERPYTCPHCNKGFVTRTHCKHHIKLVHQGVGYDLIRSNISKKVTVFEAVEAVS